MMHIERNKYIIIPISIFIGLILGILFFAYISFDVISAHGKTIDYSNFGLNLEQEGNSGRVGFISEDSNEQISLNNDNVKDKLLDGSSRDISSILVDINKTLEQRAREEAERKKRLKDEHYAKVKEKIDKFIEKYGMPENLPEVDWFVDEDVFVSTWATKINEYLKGSPLDSKGAVFAKAAWDNCIDPRWSPAISNTESSKGLYCFKPYNAWGWGDKAWENWEDAINEHVKELSDKYDYTIAKPLAEKYCPPNHEHWYNTTLEQMRLITKLAS